jgi:hypothetical protein
MIESVATNATHMPTMSRKVALGTVKIAVKNITIGRGTKLFQMRRDFDRSTLISGSTRSGGFAAGDFDKFSASWVKLSLKGFSSDLMNSII